MQLGSMLTRQLPNAAYRYSAWGIVPFLVDPFRVDRPNREALEAAMGSVPAKTAAWRMSLLSLFEVERLPLERMTHPVLLVAGESDLLLPSKREAKSLQARFPNAKLTLLPKSGHACLLESETNLQQILQQQSFFRALAMSFWEGLVERLVKRLARTSGALPLSFIKERALHFFN